MTHVFGKTLRATVQIQKGELQIDDLRLHDEVLVRHYELPDQKLTFELGADAVHVTQGNGPNTENIIARGHPVRVRAEELELTTEFLQLDRGHGRIRTDHPGQMLVTVPPKVDSNRPQPNGPTTITWKNRMDFDGRRARFGGEVEVLTPDQRLRAANLAFDLNRRIRLDGKPDDSPTSRNTDEIDIERVQAEGRVQVESRELESGQLVSLTYVSVPYAEFYRTTGDFRATGPGRVVTVRKGFQRSLDLAERTTTRRVAMRTNAPPDQKTFLQVDYQHEVRGNLNRRLVQFQQHVNVIYGPVQSWNERLTADQSLRADDVLLSCDELTVSQTALARGRQPATIELAAVGNTTVEGQSFTAQGNRVSFDQSKELLVLEGTTTVDATLHHQSRIGAPQSRVSARKILYWLRTKRVSLDDARLLDVRQ